MSKPVRIDRFGREVRLDRFGMEYVNAHDQAWYLTPCCDASAKGWEDGIVCRSCFEYIDPIYGGVPEPLDEDMTDDERRRLEEWKQWERDMVARALGRKS